jgi:uncharacterized repeat protein (TIGR03803 family)
MARSFFVLAVSLLIGALSPAAASHYQVIHSFCAESNCADGAYPSSGVIRDPSGTLYGVALSGGYAGSSSAGVVYALAPDGDGWQYQVLYSFCSQPLCADGESPTAGLIEDVQGNLYGTAQIAGGPGDGGVVFKLTHDAARTNWTYSKLHTFCIKRKKCPDGGNPSSALTYPGAASGALYDGVSPLYGTTGFGNEPGNVYELSPNTDGTWTATVVYTFCTETGCPVGFVPGGGLVMDAGGHLFVNTLKGYSGQSGGIVELTQKHAAWTAKRIYSFCSAFDCFDGDGPIGNLAFDAAGDLVGTAEYDGEHTYGTLYALVPKNRKWKQRVLYRFCRLENCTDGGEPRGGVTIDGAGNLIGTTSDYGAQAGGGTVFRYSAGKFELLYTFCQQASCTDGNFPQSAPITDSAGDIFGTTDSGGANYSHGTIYEITP